jgi:hypothetical protein
MIASAILAVGCTAHVALPECNAAMAAPVLTVDLRPYALTHPQLETKICLTEFGSRRTAICGDFHVDEDGTARPFAYQPGYARPRSDGVTIGAPPGGMTVAVTLRSQGAVTRSSLRVAGEPGRCGAWTYPQVSLTSEGLLTS